MLNLWHVCITCPCIVLNSQHAWAIYLSIILLCVPTYIVFGTAIVVTIPITIAVCHISAMVHVHGHVWFTGKAIVVCWVSPPEGDQCLCSGLGNLVSKVLLNGQRHMPNVLLVSHESTSLC